MPLQLPLCFSLWVEAWFGAVHSLKVFAGLLSFTLFSFSNFLSSKNIFICFIGQLRRDLINPLSPNGDQHQFSPNDVHTLSRDMVMRTGKMITKVKLH